MRITLYRLQCIKMWKAFSTDELSVTCRLKNKFDLSELQLMRRRAWWSSRLKSLIFEEACNWIEVLFQSDIADGNNAFSNTSSLGNEI